MDIDAFIALHKNKLQHDREELTPKPHADSSTERHPTKNCNEVADHGKQSATMDFLGQVNDPPAPDNVQESSIATYPSAHYPPNFDGLDAKMSVREIYEKLEQKYHELNKEPCVDKTVKDLANLTEREGADDNLKNRKIRKTKDEMDQWVSDTFYSYFPGYNNENKKRQEILRDRQLEYQQNFLKHKAKAIANNIEKNNKMKNSDNTQTPRTPENKEKTLNTNPQQKPYTSRSADKTDLEIIVNNPDYESRSPRPGSARHKLLQDLRHTEISKIVNSDGVTERNRHYAEMEMAKKKDYHKELMAQIEEKRRAIEVMKEKERRQEEALTRKLQEQLRTIHLQEELEKEKMRADKVRFDNEQNRLMREHLLSKLESDTKLLLSSRKSRSENDKVVPPENKVYQYFSNSARHEYRRGDNPEPPAFHLDLPQPSTHRQECIHQNENICPFCSSSLKTYETLCLKCENRIYDPAKGDLRQLFCGDCKKQYSICTNCEKSDEINCVHCQQKRNICANCRKKLCSSCIEEMVSGKSRSEPDSSFQILEMNYPETSDEDPPPPRKLNNKPERSRQPYSMNIDRNSIFHEDFNQSKLFDDPNNIEKIKNETHKRLSRYLKNYGDLVGKTLRDRGTQTTPDSASRRDVVMVEENNLSMPLLREMPKMTRKESNLQQAERKRKGTRIESLARKWEIPAVQKHTITTNSPKVLTQLGAIRKQLQSEQFQLNY